MATTQKGEAREGIAGIIRKYPINTILTGSIVILYVGFGLATDHFFSTANLTNMANQVSIVVIISVAMTLVIAARGLDISSGSIVALSGTAGALALGAGAGTFVAVVVMLAVGAGVGLTNGILIAGFNISPFMATLAMLAAAAGASLTLSGGGIPVDSPFISWVGNGQIGPMPVSAVIAVISILVGALVIGRTKLGRWSEAVGGNPVTAAASLIPVRTIRLVGYVLTGFSAGLGAIITVGMLGSAQPQAGSALVFSAITAVIIGGTRLTGGEAHLGGTVLGALLVQVITTGLAYVDAPPAVTAIATGALIAIAVTFHTPRLGARIRETARALVHEIWPSARQNVAVARSEQRTLALDGVDKRYPGVTALDGVSLTLGGGGVVALLGENGAGKSTLVKILAGAEQPTSGSIRIDGHPVVFAVPDDATATGISVIHQHFTLAPELTVWQNLYLGHELRYRGTPVLRIGQMRREALRLLNSIDVSIDVDARVEDLAIGEQQQVEIARALRYDAWLVVMDEPSSSLGEHECDALYARVRDLARRGVTVLYISHRMEEIFDLASKAVVLRDGKIVGQVDIANATEGELIRMMVGREVHDRLAHTEPAAPTGQPLLEVAGLSDHHVLRDVSFEAYPGEIVSFVGLIGAGSSETLRCLAGIDRFTGTVRVRGREVGGLTPYRASQLGIAWVPGDRHSAGLILPLTVSKNLGLSWLRHQKSYGLVNVANERDLAWRMVRELNIRPRSIAMRVAQLSGGNQQKVVLGRALSIDPTIMLLDDPTRGVDIGAKAEIHALIRRLRAGGAAIVMFSSELPEALALADRVVVFRDGSTVAEVAPTTPPDEVMNYALGSQRVLR